MKWFISLNISRFKSLILNLINYNNSKYGDNNIENNKKNYDFKTFKFFNLNEINTKENVIIINEFKF